MEGRGRGINANYEDRPSLTAYGGACKVGVELGAKKAPRGAARAGGGVAGGVKGGEEKTTPPLTKIFTPLLEPQHPRTPLSSTLRYVHITDSPDYPWHNSSGSFLRPLREGLR